MRRHLESVYQDLFGFLQIAARIFTASSGSTFRIGAFPKDIALTIYQKSNALWV